MAGIGQYFRDTQAELRHVAWPTQAQTIVYTVLVAAISIGIALYLGLFDYLFTTGLSHTVTGNGGSAQVAQQQATTAPTGGATSAPSFDLQ